MTYHTPELLLVGAAQNVVHFDSFGAGARKFQGSCGIEEESVPDVYNPASLW